MIRNKGSNTPVRKTLPSTLKTTKHSKKTPPSTLKTTKYSKTYLSSKSGKKTSKSRSVAKQNNIEFMEKSNIINKLLSNQETLEEIKSNVFDDAWKFYTPKKQSTIINFFEQMAVKKGSQIVEIKNDVYKPMKKDKPSERYPFYELAMAKSIHRLINYNRIYINGCEKDFSLKIVGVRGNNRKIITDVDVMNTVFELSTKNSEIKTSNLGCRVMLYKKNDIGYEKNNKIETLKPGMHPSDVYIQLSRLFNNLVLENKTQNLLLHYKDFNCNKFFTTNKTIPSRNQCKNKNGVVHKRLCSLRAIYNQKMVENKAVVCIQELGTMNMHEWIQYENPSLIEWKSVLFQILYTLIVLQKSIDGFMHNGLSTKHIIMCRCQKGGMFTYKLKGVVYNVHNIGWIPKIIPCEFSNVNGVFDNSRVFDPLVQINLGITDSIDYTYDIHYLMNLIFSYDETNEDVKKWCLKNYGISYLSDKSMHVNNYRKRYNVNHKKLKTPQMLISSNFFNLFNKSYKNTVKLYPKFSV
tara:strand:+ start:1032 stop:2594 length:1563 start_codon:yes stop_codon:yes gene_type:complete